MSFPARDSLPGSGRESTAPPCIQSDCVELAGPLAVPEGARRLAVFVHPAPAGRDHAGYRFVGDVLRANGVATLSVSLRTAEEAACSAPPVAAQTQVRRLQGVLARLGESPPTRGLRLALVGVNEAAALCVQASRQPGFEAIGSLVLLDGRVDLGPTELASWRQPTLYIVGRHAAPGSAPTRAGVRCWPRPHRLVRLPMRTQPRASAGAYEAIACELAAWLRQQAAPPPEPVLPPATTIASAQ